MYLFLRGCMLQYQLTESISMLRVFCCLTSVDFLRKKKSNRGVKCEQLNIRKSQEIC